MNRKISTFLLAVVAGMATVGCSDWTTPEAEWLDPYLPTEVAKDDAYYEALRAYKASDHSIAFGWFSGWGEPSLSTTAMLSGVPDSMDIVSLWSNYRELSPAKIEDLRYVQEKKGTKVVICMFINDIGANITPAEYDTDQNSRNEFWGWVDGDDAAKTAAIEKYAKALADTVDFYGYDGLDIDYEGSGNLNSNSATYVQFISELGKYLGPKSGTEKMLIIDGYINRLPAEVGPYCNYLVSQAYSISGGSPSATAGMSANTGRGTYMTGDYPLQTRLNQVISQFSSTMTEEEVTKKFVVTENLESASDCLKGGFYWTDDQGRTWDKDLMPSLVGFASWEPESGIRKGGFGAYQFGYEAANTPSYKWMRKAIQQQNPAPDCTTYLSPDDYEPVE